MAVSALKKITVKDIMKGKPERAKVMITKKDEDTGELRELEVSQVIAQDVCIIYGRAHSSETGSTQFGPYTTFIGSFEGRRIRDGEVFQSTRIIFPPIADGIALEAYMGAKAADPTAQVDFAFVVGVEHDARGAEGYKFTCKPVNTGANTHDPLAELRLSLASSFAAALGSDRMAALGLEAPGSGALKIGQGEAVAASEGTSKGKAKPEA